MAEITRTMSEWIEIDQQERRQRRELLRELAEYQKTHPPLIMAAFRPRAAAAPPAPPPMPGVVELSDNPSHEEVADYLGISPDQLVTELGGMTFERLCGRLNMPPKQVAETLRLMSWSGAKITGLRRSVSMLMQFGLKACKAVASRRAERKRITDPRGKVAQLRAEAVRKMNAKARKLRG
jgi:hypothetical protein